MMLTVLAITAVLVCLFYAEQPTLQEFAETIDENIAELRKWIVILEVAYLVLVVVLFCKRKSPAEPVEFMVE